MHWSDEIARELVKRKPDKEEYVCAAGISPSGSIHIGNFRDIATSAFVAKALERMGKKVRFIFSWDEYDRMRKVPANVAAVNSDMEKYIGCPYTSVPNPFPTAERTYAEYFEKEFEEGVAPFGLNLEFRHQAELYTSGRYTEHIIFALRRRGEIFDILNSFRTQQAAEGERDNYYPVSIFCPSCGRDTTKIHELSDDCERALYSCECGHKGTFDFKKDHNCKLQWKVDWPMRWMYEGVDFEPGGKDHASPGGSYDTSSRIAREIFNIEPPYFQGYEFIGIKGQTGKMSGSTGLNLTPGELLHIYQPEVILWLYARAQPNKVFNFCLDDGILRQYFEFDRQYDDFMDNRADEHVSDVMRNCIISDRRLKTVSMSLLAQLGSIVDFNPEMLEVVFKKINMPYTREDFAERMGLAKYWLEHCAPESVNRLRTCRDFEYYNSMDADGKRAVALLYKFLSKEEYGLEELNTKLYDIPKEVWGIDNPDIKKIQGQFFKNVYTLLLGKPSGPRLYLFLYAIEKERFLHLLDFSAPPSPAEIESANDAATADVVQEVSAEPDPVAPVKDEIDIETFGRADLRVCRIKKCSPIRKAQNLYKLTLDDGTPRERVIVSGLKKYYEPEQLEGRSVIVIVNLKPHKFCNVVSEGMLLAATNNACGCRVIFADGAIPPGTALG